MRCTLCPRKCLAERDLSCGACGADNRIKIARAAAHFWEEPCISGKNGSGAVFFSGCTLRCVYCQNYEISSGGGGEFVSEDKFVSILFFTLHSNIDCFWNSIYIWHSFCLCTSRTPKLFFIAPSRMFYVT